MQGAYGVIHGQPLKYKNCAHHLLYLVEMDKRGAPEDETIAARDSVRL